MSAAVDQHLRNIAYRRGTVMGLTAAEAFMLIAFILLFMLVAWRSSVESEVLALKEANKALVPMLKDLESSESFGHVIRLVQEEKLRTLMSAAFYQPEEKLQKLTDMVLADDLAASLELVDEARKAGLIAEEISQVANSMGELETLRKQLAESVARADAAEEALAEVKERSDRASRTGADIARVISESVGDRIATMGGRVLPDGDVIFPDSVLFKAGSADISQEFDQLLSTFCRLWFETLYDQREFLDAVQLEGHASSEFLGLSDEVAFVANLDLSQRRAAAVFVRCLDYSGDDDIALWARSAMAAIGYSSSRLIMSNGVENKRASRRVVFATKPRTTIDVVADVFNEDERIGEYSKPAISPGSNNYIFSDEDTDSSGIPGISDYRQLGGDWIEGDVQVTDGDTVVVGTKAIRLQGLHAEETTTALGRQAKEFMSDMIMDRRVVCWLNGEKSFNRFIGVCFLDGKDVAAPLVSAGLGWDCPRYSGGRYDALQSVQQKVTAKLPDYC